MSKTLPPRLLWGKADPEVSPEPHPAELHMLDVAAVATELLERGLPRALRDDLLAFAPGVSIGVDDLALVVACHDIGKLTPGFAAKAKVLRARLLEAGASFPDTAVTDHAQSTSVLGQRLLSSRGADEEAAKLMMAAVGGHHGRFHGLDGRQPPAAKYGGAEWHRAREDAVDRLVQALHADPSRFSTTPSEQWLMAVAGLTVVADWIGSDSSYFPYAPGEVASTEYFARARRQARTAIDQLGWRTVTTARQSPRFEDLFPGCTPRPMQQTVMDMVDALDRPGLVLVEAPTGGGKTEAAIYAAESMMARFGLGGLYFGLPTQATSNQMFERVRAYLQWRFSDGTVNLHLLHSNKALNEEYAALRTRAVDGPARSDASVVADLWFQGRKRGLLSPFAVGTIDQAMMAALRSRHFFLRMLGLARKVLVIDEVHAYDAFMSQILDRLLVWLRALGSGVVLLSATLPAQRRNQLLECWAGDQPGSSRPAKRTDPPYPRCIAVGSRREEVAIPRTSESSRTTYLRWVRGNARAVAEDLVAALRTGGCAAWIHNTVREAQAAYDELRQLDWPEHERVLFHARFPIEDRLEREQRVLSLLAKSAKRPQRLIVVATQVIEQSLDLDVDLMVSELAPIDLLVQRAGRLQRHGSRDPYRPADLRVPTLWIHVGGTEEDPQFGPSAFVYDEHVLLRTWWTLQHRQCWRVPDQADELMDAVYPSCCEDAVPNELSVVLAGRWTQTARGLRHALQVAASKGQVQLVPKPARPEAGESFLDDLGESLDDPEEAPHKHPDVLAKTRDIEATVTLVCLAEGPMLSPSKTTPVPLDDTEVPRWLVRKLLDRAVTIQDRRVIEACAGCRAPAGWRKTPLLRHLHPVEFDHNGNARLGGVTLRLDPELGLIIENEA